MERRQKRGREFDWRGTVRKRVEIVNRGLGEERYWVIEGEDGGMEVELWVLDRMVWRKGVDGGNYGGILDQITLGVGFMMDN